MEKTTRRRAEERTLMKDERAVSPVIGVILMIAITVVIAAVVASFAYGIIGGVATAPNAALVFEDADAGKTNITLVHHGGDSITDAFTGTGLANGSWGDMIVKHNGATVTWKDNVMEGGDGDDNFESGEQLEINVTTKLVSGDTLSVVYGPTGDVLQRVKVA
jgi:flagellin-like protein